MNSLAVDPFYHVAFIAVDVTADAVGDQNISSSLRVTCHYYMQEKMACRNYPSIIHTILEKIED